jgi:nicotinate-nucleotide--dimethylbenzimidazole phosphoribosyltransferase
VPDLDDVIASITGPDAEAMTAARARQDLLTKPRGSLGVLEAISIQLAGLAGVCPPPLPEPAAVAVFAGDHGVHAQGVTPWPQEVTAQMVANFLAGGAVINALARQAGADVVVVDVGVAADLPEHPSLISRNVRHGTGDITSEPAMSHTEALAAIQVGIDVSSELIADGHRVLITGDMGIANTTASAALVCAFTGADPAEVTGRGTGIDEAMLAHKITVVRAALQRHDLDGALARDGAGRADPIETLAAIGGLEHAALTGFLLAAAAARVPVILDGLIACSAALAASALAPLSVAAMIAGHRSVEPGARTALDKLGLRPLIDLDMRLGEGSGAALALGLVQSAARVLREVSTFDGAGVTDKDGP